MSPLPILTFLESRRLDEAVVQGGHATGFELMRRAGEGMAREIAGLCARRNFSRDILLLAGKGNNGGDVFVAARALGERGFSPRVLLTHSRESLKGDALSHFKKMAEAKVPFSEVGLGNDFFECLKSFSGDVVVDGLLGTGFRPPLKSGYREIIEALNAGNFWVIAADVPSGMSEEKDSLCVRADCTLAVGSFKREFLSPENAARCGRIIPLDIGFPVSLWGERHADTCVFVEDDLKNLLKRRPRSAHKGVFGRVFLAGGSYGFSGALVLAGLGALRSGCGLLTLASPDSKARDSVHSALSEAMTTEFSNPDPKKMEKFDALGLGPGLGTSGKARKRLSEMLQSGRQPLVLDADALNIISEKKQPFKKTARPVVLTPHPGEASRLLKWTLAKVEGERFLTTRALREKFGAWIVLKGAHTVVCGPEGIRLHVTGTPAMASGGMGDVLTGMIVSFLAQGFSPWDACNIAVALHGMAAEALECEAGPFGILASEVAAKIPAVVKTLGRLKAGS